MSQLVKSTLNPFILGNREIWEKSEKLGKLSFLRCISIVSLNEESPALGSCSVSLIVWTRNEGSFAQETIPKLIKSGPLIPPNEVHFPGFFFFIATPK